MGHQDCTISTTPTVSPSAHSPYTACFTSLVEFALWAPFGAIGPIPWSASVDRYFPPSKVAYIPGLVSTEGCSNWRIFRKSRRDTRSQKSSTFALGNTSRLRVPQSLVVCQHLPHCYTYIAKLTASTSDRSQLCPCESPQARDFPSAHHSSEDNRPPVDRIPAGNPRRYQQPPTAKKG